MTNSVKQIEKYLELTVLASESKIQREVFGYNRTESFESNKKYADLLRRGWYKDLYERVEISVPGIRSRIFYYKGRKGEMETLLANQGETVESFILKNEI
jgi:hypothetical protein